MGRQYSKRYLKGLQGLGVRRVNFTLFVMDSVTRVPLLSVPRNTSLGRVWGSEIDSGVNLSGTKECGVPKTRTARETGFTRRKNPTQLRVRKTARVELREGVPSGEDQGTVE